MKFATQRLFAYDKAVFQPETLNALTSHEGLIDRETFKQSGIMDLRAALEISQEYSHQFPIITIKELARTVDGNGQLVDSIYREPVKNLARSKIDRTLSMNGYVTFDSPLNEHKKQGMKLTQPIKVAFCLLDLHKFDYFPDVGDQVVFLGRLYDMAAVYIEPTDLFQNTMVPFYIHALCGLHQFGDHLPPASITAAPVIPDVEPTIQRVVNRNNVSR